MRRTFFRTWGVLGEKLAHHPDAYIIGLFVVLGIVSHLQWFNPFSILEYGDWAYRPDEHVRELFQGWMTWMPFEGFGMPNILLSAWPVRGLAWSAIVNAGLSYDIATKLTLFIPVALGSFTAPYLLVKKLTDTRLISVVCALYYGSTAYFLSIQTVHIPIALLYALLPIMMYVLILALEKNRAWQWILLAMLVTLGIFYEVRIMYIEALILASYAVFYLIHDRPHVRPYIKNVLLASGVLVVLNLFWLIPTRLGAAEAITDVAGRGVFGDFLFNLQHAFAVMKWDWTGGLIDRSFTPQPVPIYLWFPPLVAIGTLLFSKKYRAYQIYFLILLLAGLFLAKQSAEPLTSAYDWFYGNLPGFVLFREASKFYVLPAFAFMGLLAFGLLGIKTKQRPLRHEKLFFAGGAALIVIVALINLKPAVTTEIGATFKDSVVPKDYKTLKHFLKQDTEYGRVLWMPRAAWWGFYDNTHPRVNAVDIAQKEWRDFNPVSGSAHLVNNGRQAMIALEEDFAEHLMQAGDIKYVAVPTRDTENNEDFFPYYGDDRQYYIEQLDKLGFLKRVKLDTKELVVYRNTRHVSYMNATAKVTALDSFDDVEQAYTFGRQEFPGEDLDITTMQEGQDLPFSTFRDVFDNLRATQPAGQSITRTISVSDESDAQLYVDAGRPQFSYQLTDGQVTFYKTTDNQLLVNDRSLPAAGEQKQPLATRALDESRDYFVSQGKELLTLDPSGARDRNLGLSQDALILYSASKQNLVPNHSLEKGPWQREVEDCNAYNDDSILSMNVTDEASTDLLKALRLAAYSHTACTGPGPIAVQPEQDYLFAFDYRVENGRRVSYEIRFNDPDKTVIKEDVPSGGHSWRRVQHRLTIPAGATQVSLLVRAHPDDTFQTQPVVFYDNFRLAALQQEQVLHPAYTPQYHTVELPSGNNTFHYKNGAKYKNILPNPSFEDGLWQKTVGDCNNFDDKPKLGMQLQDKDTTHGKRALQLAAARHVACTGPDEIPVQEGTRYLLQFDHQSPNAQFLGYSVSFNDPAGTTLSKRTLVEDTDWQTLTETLSVPYGATTMKLRVYAYSDPERSTAIMNRYDNFSLLELPDILDKYYLVTKPKQKLAKPRTVDSEHLSPTKKSAQITGATDPFYLTMSERYHPKWRLELDSQKARTWKPWALPESVSSKQHFELNGFMNGWYIDPAKLCQNNPAGCTRHADGSYDIDLIAEFTPQRWFYLGLIISGVGLLGVGVYFAYLGLRKRRKARGSVWRWHKG